MILCSTKPILSVKFSIKKTHRKIYFHLSKIALFIVYYGLYERQWLIYGREAKWHAESCHLVGFASYNLVLFKHLRKQIWIADWGNYLNCISNIKGRESAQTGLSLSQVTEHFRVQIIQARVILLNQKKENSKEASRALFSIKSSWFRLLFILVCYL